MPGMPGRDMPGRMGMGGLMVCTGTGSGFGSGVGSGLAARAATAAALVAAAEAISAWVAAALERAFRAGAGVGALLAALVSAFAGDFAEGLAGAGLEVWVTVAFSGAGPGFVGAAGMDGFAGGGAAFGPVAGACRGLDTGAMGFAGLRAGGAGALAGVAAALPLAGMAFDAAGLADLPAAAFVTGGGAGALGAAARGAAGLACGLAFMAGFAAAAFVATLPGFAATAFAAEVFAAEVFAAEVFAAEVFAAEVFAAGAFAEDAFPPGAFAGAERGAGLGAAALLPPFPTACGGALALLRDALGMGEPFTHCPDGGSRMDEAGAAREWPRQANRPFGDRLRHPRIGRRQPACLRYDEFWQGKPEELVNTSHDPPIQT